jgi:flagellar basal body rod protein FlgC
MQAFSIAAAGMLGAQGRFDASARRTAADPLNNLEQETVQRIQDKTAFSANAAVLKTADEMTGAVLDILA